MKIIIFGAGGVGCVVGGYLWHAGSEIVLVGRPGQVQAINERGLKLITPLGDHVLPLPAVTHISRINLSPDAVFVCVKGQDTEKAILELKSAFGNIPVFCLQNGVRNEEIAAQHFSKVYGAMLRFGVEYLKDGEVLVRNAPPGLIILGIYPRGIDRLAEEIAQKLRAAGFLVQVSEEIMAYKWGKLVSNLGNAVIAITNAYGEDVDLIAKAAKKELIALLEEADIRWISQTEVAQKWPELKMPEQSDVNSKIRSSTWQSLARRQGSIETEFLNGELVRLAKILGRSAPVNEKLTQISQEMASSRQIPGKYTPHELASMLGV
jgi:2-dehydropantoate 2-reductase